ncbi:GAF and ANTAR domain-containing protein [Cellulomonas sp. P5_C6]
MQLLPQTVDALRRLGESSEVDLLALVADAGDRVAAEVPSCLGFSYCLGTEDLTFTVVATSAESAAMDSAQYLDDGPCLQAGRDEVEVGIDDILDEDRWQQFASTAAGRGVRSSLSLPVLDHGTLVGTVNFYAARPRAFRGHEAQLAAIVGASAHRAISNADLDFRSLDDAVVAPTHLDELAVINQALGILAHSRRIGIDEARTVLHRAAERAGLGDADVARTVVGT